MKLGASAWTCNDLPRDDGAADRLGEASLRAFDARGQLDRCEQHRTSIGQFLRI